METVAFKCILSTVGRRCVQVCDGRDGFLGSARGRAGHHLHRVASGQLILASGARQTCRKELLSLSWLVGGQASSLWWQSNFSSPTKKSDAKQRSGVEGAQKKKGENKPSPGSEYVEACDSGGPLLITPRSCNRRHSEVRAPRRLAGWRPSGGTTTALHPR